MPRYCFSRPFTRVARRFVGHKNRWKNQNVCDPGRRECRCGAPRRNLLRCRTGFLIEPKTGLGIENVRKLKSRTGTWSVRDFNFPYVSKFRLFSFLIFIELSFRLRVHCGGGAAKTRVICSEVLVCVRVGACVRVRPSVSWCVRARSVALGLAEASFLSFEDANRLIWHQFAPWELNIYL